MEAYLSEYFPGLLVERPMFYSWPVGLRFAIGPEAVSVWKDEDREVLNEAYFSEALKRATYIFGQVFGVDDDVIIVYQGYSYNKQYISEAFDIFGCVGPVNPDEVIYSDITDIYVDGETEGLDAGCWKRASLKVKAGDLDYSAILDAGINTDFGSRGTRLSGECYFIHTSRNIILNLYDDRGMDVIAADKTSLEELYVSCNQWILDYDREKIDAVFKSK